MKDERQTILIVDDESMNFSILSQVLKGMYRVLVAKSGEQALKIVAQDKVDCILLDILMPAMDGYEVLRHLKNTENSKEIPVIFITSKSQHQDEAKGLQLGAVDYIRKPFYLPIVKARVQTHLELKLKNEILTELVAIDGLTNIYNRRKFDQTLQEEWKRALRAGTPLSLLIVDVDHFKLFNDNYGHAAGDACLRKVTAALKACLRRPGDFLARYGGEEFTMILPNTDHNGAAWMADEVRRHVKELALPHEFSPVAGHVTVSAGGATSTAGGACKTPQALLEMADRMLYEAKKSGRDRCRIHLCEDRDESI